MAAVPFHDVDPNASVRFVVIDGTAHFSVRDIIMVNNCYALEHHDDSIKQRQMRVSQIWKKIPENLKLDLYQFCQTFQFHGTGQRLQPVVKLEGVSKLLTYIPSGKLTDDHEKTVATLHHHVTNEHGDDDSDEESSICNDSDSDTVAVRKLNALLRDQLHIKQALYKVDEENRQQILTYEQEMLKIKEQAATHDITREEKLLDILARRNAIDLEYRRAC